MASRSNQGRPDAPRQAPATPEGPGRGSPPRRRLLVIILSGFALAVALSLATRAAIVRVRVEERVFRLSAAPGARAERLVTGWHLRVPLLQRIERVPAGPIRVAGEVEVRSREGVSLRVPYEISAEIGDPALATLLATALGREGPDAALGARTAAAIRKWADGASGEALVLRQGAAAAERDLERGLKDLGFDWSSVSLGKVQGPPEVIAAIESGALRDRVLDTKTKIAILGLDAADWQIIDPLIARGQLPNLARLKARGAWGNMKSLFPMLSPILWTSVATGKPAEQHGIIDFLVKEASTGKEVPVSSRWRKVKALWNIFTDAGKSSAFVAWWATWPAEQVNGRIVSDRVAYSLFGFDAAGDRAGLTYPPGYVQEIRPLIVRDDSIPLAEIQKFVSVTPEEYRALREKIREDPKVAYRLPVNHLAKILASARTYQSIGLDILGRGQPDLFSVYYEGIDEVCHRFAHYVPPKMGMVTQEEYDKYHDAVFAYYRYQDRLVGEMLAKLSPDTTVIVMSDHGFRNGSDRPPNDPPYVEWKPGLWHRRYGIAIFSGPFIKPGRLDTTSLLDIAPTVLYLAGLPVPEDMAGRVVLEAIDERFKSRFPVRTIPSYDGIGRPLEQGKELVAQSGADAEMLEKLKSLGYIGGGAGSDGSATGSAARDTGAPGTSAVSGAVDGGSRAAGGAPGAAGPGGADQRLVTSYVNEAGLQLKAKDYEKAAATVAQALKVVPDFPPGLILSVQIDAARKNYGSAIATAHRVIDINPEADSGIYLQLGRVYADSGRTDEGLTYLGRLESDHPQMAAIHSALGSIHVKRGENEAARKEFLEALEIDPSLEEPLVELHKMYQGTGQVLTLEPLVRRGLAMNDRSVVHHNWMGFIYEWKKDIPRSESEFKRALELDPDDAATLANLGALYGRAGRLTEAVAVLDRAVEKDPENMESWVNLGAAQGRMGRAREAIQALETARRKGLKTTTLFNALALAYLQDHQRERALQYLRESLSIDPNQKDAQDLLRAVSRSS